MRSNREARLQGVTRERAVNHKAGWTDSDVATLVRMTEDGATRAEVALALGRSLGSISGKRAALIATGRIQPLRHRFTGDELGLMIAMRQQGQTVAQIADHTGRPWSSVKKALSSQPTCRREPSSECERYEALRLYNDGLSLITVGGILGRSRSAIWKWIATFRSEGEWVRPNPPPGPRAKAIQQPKGVTK